MILQLSYNEHKVGPVRAAILPGGDPVGWLTEISRWGTPAGTLKCFVLPESIAVHQAAGLLVIFSGPVDFALRYPYREFVEGFYIPVHAGLKPQVGVEEAESLKRWPVQVFHPHIGLVGYEEKDQLNLADLIVLPAVKPALWLQHIPLDKTLYPRLQSIRLEPEEEPLDAMAALHALIEQKPFDEIPNVEEEQQGKLKLLLRKTGRLLGTLGLWVLLILALIGKVIFGVIAAFFQIKRNPYRIADRQGLLQKLENWVHNRLKDLKKQRDSELNRLVKMFDKNKDEALNYAIPLNSPYLNRGVAPKSGKLSRRNINWGFGGFGGGRVDAWDLGEYRNVLRLRYLDTAKKALENGDHKKAAYIHAHLLGDLFTAAQVLQNGKHYREAAALYKDHLHNKVRAAECLELGGLLGEAIPLWVELNNFEKVGDLYAQLGQEAKAHQYYADMVKRSLDNKDYLNAARLSIIKMQDKTAGRQILLDGWKDDQQAETCLKTYLESIEDLAGQLEREVKQVYEHHVSVRKRTGFLNVLADLATRHNQEGLKQTALGIAYEIVQAQTLSGDHSGLRLLTKFLPDDKLLGQDANRYMLRNKPQHRMVMADSYMKLQTDVRWLELVAYHDQLIGIGVKKRDVILLRANWSGKTTYQMLFTFPSEPQKLQLVADGNLSSNLMLMGHDVPFQTLKKLDRYSDFERELNLHQLHWKLPNTLAVGLHADHQELYFLHGDGDDVCLDLFSLEGRLLYRSVVTHHEERLSIYDLPVITHPAMFWRKEHFYLSGKDCLVRMDQEGRMEVLSLPSAVIGWSVPNPHAALKIAMLTDDGCLIVTPGLKEMVISAELFAQGFGAHLVQLLADNRLVLANESLAMVFDISRAQPKLIFEIQSENKILKILTVPKRHHFALLESDNRISVHRLKED